MGCKLTTTSGFCMPFDETGLHNETSQPLLVLKSFCLMFLHSDYMQFSSKLIQFCRSHKLYRLLAQPDRFILLEELRADKEMNCKMSYQCWMLTLPTKVKWEGMMRHYRCMSNEQRPQWRNLMTWKNDYPLSWQRPLTATAIT